MRGISQVIPDYDVLLGIGPEELGGKILFLLRKTILPHAKFSPYNLINDLWRPGFPISGAQPPYPEQKREEITLALSEAWAWLQAQGLVVPAIDTSSSGWFQLSRRAQAFESETEFFRFATARMLQKEALNPRIANSVWMAFMRGEFDVAVFLAMKAVEIAVREASGLSASLIGVVLMRKAFDPDTGALTDFASEKGERDACSALFAGAIGSYKNPQSHRDVQLDNPTEAMEIIMMANHLLRIVDSRQKTKI
jgi:uncharacterized protein (TIGR02391 family)